MEQDQKCTSATVHEMNKHLANILSMIHEGSAEKDASIREEIKQYFTLVENIKREVAKNEVENINYVKRCELQAIEQQKEKVSAFIEHFDSQIAQIEEKVRESVGQNSAILDC